MKNIPLCLALLLILVSSCNKGHEKSGNNTIIVAGRVTGYDLMNPFVTITPNRVAVGRENIRAYLDEEGYFKASFVSLIPIDFYVSCKTNFLVLAHPGDSIFVEFNGSAEDRPTLLKNIKFSGDFAEENQDAAMFQLMRFSDNFYPNVEKRYSLMKVYDPVRFKAYMDSCRSEWHRMVSLFEEKYNPSAEVLKWAKIAIDVDYYRDLLHYPSSYTREEKPDHRSVPLIYYDFMKDHFSIDSSILLSGYSLFGFVDSYASYIMAIIRDENQTFFESREWVKNHPEVFDSIRFFGTIRYTDEPLLRQMALTEMLYEGLEFSRVEIFERYSKEIDSIITEPYLRGPLFSEYASTMARLNNPEIASGIIMNKLKSKAVLASIDSIISLNKGKVVYLDCWATWCGPCMAEMPFSVRLIKEFEGKDIAFVFVCVDSEEKNWKAALAKFDLRGQHILLDKAQSFEFRQAFNISGIPHYVLFGSDGKVIENNTLPPSGVRPRLKELVNW